MEIFSTLIDFVLHINEHLDRIISDYRNWTYLILFLIVFCETGLVVTPFLPGDSLLFAAGAFADPDAAKLNIVVLISVLFVAAVLGNSVNYTAGRLIGNRIFEKNYRFIKRRYLEEAKSFYDKYGAITIVITRFIPIVRTFAPFVAGVGAMKIRKFQFYNIMGGLAWVSIFCLGGYFVGNQPIVKRNFSLVIVGIIIVSIMPPVIQYILHKFRKAKLEE